MRTIILTLLMGTVLCHAPIPSAFAADLPSQKAAAYAPPPEPMIWNGSYAGLNIGGGWNAGSGNNEVSTYWDPNYAFASTVPELTIGSGPRPNLFFIPNGLPRGSEGGVIGGLQLGYNYQFKPSVLVGVETDFQGSSIGGHGDSNFGLLPSPFASCSQLPGAPECTGHNGVLIPASAIGGGRLSLDWIGTLRGRAGWLFTPTLLVYGTAGFAYGGVEAWRFNNIRTGWTAGGGLEWMFAPNWSAKVEYLYADLNSGGGSGAFDWNWGYHFHPQFNIVRAGLNYHFNRADAAQLLEKR